MENLTDAQWRLLASELRAARTAVLDAAAAYRTAERDFARKLGAGGAIVVGPYRLSSPDGETVVVTAMRVVA